ncbi:type IV pilin protein [Thiotrichales bacterium 19X7-9]|nr:type IV pilin protein [Thiotrichales bacterium 19X7-9]
MKQHQGFTFIEIIIVMVIIGIIVLIAVPSYYSYIQHSRRYEAISALESLYLLQEKHHLRYDTYATLKQLTHTNITDNHYYQLSVSNISENSFILKASAIDSQKDDREGKTNCSILTLEVNNQKTIRKPSNCWKH